jgi:hypothetical protein
MKVTTMSKNDPTGKQHVEVTKTSSQPSTELLTPKNILGGLSGINRASNKSDSMSVGVGSVQGLKLGAGLNSGIKRPSNQSGSKSVGC